MGVSFKRSLLAVSIAGALCATTSAYATNGMNMEGYGPEATAMGGASQAYDVGSAAMMNNPATIGLMETNNRFDAVLGNLRPDITSKAPATAIPPGADDTAKSSADSFFMPAVGYLRKSGEKMTWGVGVFAQGGMGTEYNGQTFMAGVDPASPTGAYNDATARSEVGVGRLVVPLSYQVNDKLIIGGSADFVWGMMDLQMIMPAMGPGMTAPPGTFADFVPAFGGSQVLGSASGSLVDSMAASGLPMANVGIDFSDDSDFTGAAKGYGISPKVGMTYAINPTLSFGASYHFKTRLSDWKTKDGDATMSVQLAADVPPFGLSAGDVVGIEGKMIIKDFQWPGQFAAGLAYKPTDQWMLAADVKYIQWKNVMNSFKMTFESNDSAGNVALGMANQSVDIEMFQDWKNQTVLQLGGAYSINNAWTLRAGLNLANNPVPDAYMNPLFPAIIKNHITGGFGWNITQQDAIDFSLAYAPKVTQTNSNTGVETEHSQTNWQLGYNRRF
jgi:long-chain fatty acid transport protein